jgi:hypothetical protein
LTLNLPANPPENALVDVSAQWGISPKLLPLGTNPQVSLSKGSPGGLVLMYADRDDPGSSNFPALKKGWQYITNSPGGNTPTVITDPIEAGYKWVLHPEN